MPSFSASTGYRTIPRLAFNRLQALLKHPETWLSLSEFIVLTEELVRGSQSASYFPAYFTLLLSPQFNVLLQGEPITTEQSVWQNFESFQVQLHFSPETITQFLTHLEQVLSAQPNQVAPDPLPYPGSPNDTALQSEFTLTLMEVLLDQNPGLNPREPAYPAVSICQPVEQALQQQLEQEQLLNQVATQIRQSLELPVILETAVQQLQRFLQVDRLLILQFEPGTTLRSEEPLIGRITYETRNSPDIPSVLHWREAEHCFVDLPHYYDLQSEGRTLALNDVTISYRDNTCMLQLMQRAGVQAKLVAPIMVQHKLWGMLIAHQCQGTRQWLESERKFLKHIAEHLEIAIYQAKIFAELQQQKQHLEERVIERTRDLHDALVSAQSASRAKSEFLAAMSHELRTPLTSVIGMASTLLRWSFGELNDRQRHYLQIIHDSGEHLMSLINDILDLSQVEAGKLVLKISDFSLHRLIHQSLQTLQEKARAAGVQLEEDFKVHPEQDLFRGDRRRIKQILLNLLSNAIKFTPEGGKVTLRAWIEGHMVILQVEDTGIGIAESQQSQLFQKFQQLDTSYGRKYEGTGLGLALTKQLVELHGGCIEVESAVNIGSIFTVRLPPQFLHLDDEPDLPETINIPPGQIILLEGQEEDANLICDLLTAANYQVVWLMDGSTALRQIDVLQPILVITAMQLPDMDGYEVIRQLRRLPHTQHLKIVALASTEQNLPSLADLGADLCLVKPIDPEPFLTQITMLFRTRSTPFPAKRTGEPL